MRRDYTFARRPIWLAGHVVAFGAIVLFIAAGLWQLDRHDTRRAADARLVDRLAAAPLDLETARGTPLEELELRRVTVAGAFDTSEELILQARSLNGRSGHNVLTPLVLDDGGAILVNRGWVPIDVAGPPVVAAAPPEGAATVTGVARLTEIRGNFGPLDPPDGDLDRISRVDLGRLSDQLPYPLDDFYLQLESPEPSGALPLLLDTPQAGGGPPHLAYAIQWFGFAAVVAVGYPMLLRSTARKRDAAR